MQRTLRARVQKRIIVISDSEDESKENSDDDVYIPEKDDTVREKAKRTRTIKVKNENDTVKEQVAKLEKAKSSKRIKKESVDPDVPKKKRQKVTKTVVPKTELNTEGLKEECHEDNKQDLDKKVNAKPKIEFTSVDCKEWTDVDYLTETNSIERHIAKNVVELFKEENTIPFIARYRKNMTGGMEADQLRALKESFDLAMIIKNKAASILKTVDKTGHWTPEIHTAIVSSKSLDDLDYIYSLFKPASKRSLAERARELGLGSVSESLLNGQNLPHLLSLVNPSKDGLKNEQQVKDGIIHIIADTINKDKVIFDKVKLLQKMYGIEIETSQSKTTEKSAEASKNKKKFTDEKKYEMYFNFSISERNIKPHHILAINRGEGQKILSVKVNLPDSVERGFRGHCLERYKCCVMASKFHSALLNDSIDYTYKKFVKPLIIRRIRNEMKEKAEVASIEVFATNVKQLLLTPPVRGKIVLGVDPGFSHGCKLAVVSEQGNILETGVIYPHKNSGSSYDESAVTLIKLITKHKCTIVALGNATACRETELFLSKLIKSKVLGGINISYTIVDEAGASIYSCSPEAKSEFPDLDPNLISAVSIARRLQDPLAELVKVEPKHLGVGMYQHDLPEKQLMLTLNEVVSEAVSFVGVDVNTASHCLLRRVAGLNIARATNIIEWRNKNGPFRNRGQLMDVKGIGNKTFEQCAGFIRILPETSMMADIKVKSKSTKNSKTVPNLFDQTWIHPESYKIANDFLNYCGCNIADLGSPKFIEKVKSCASNGCAVLAEKFRTNETTMDIIVKGLTMKKDEDIRLKANYPLFRNSMLSVNDLNAGSVLTGAVRNVTHFGAFVDIGVGTNGLIHTKNIKNQVLSVGQKVEVKVLTVEASRNRIGLELIKVL